MEHELVSIRRKKVDRNKIQGFVLDESKELLLIAYVYDLNADGLMVLRKKDVSGIETSKTDKFQTQLLKDEGIYSKIDFDVQYNLKSWKKFFKMAKHSHSYLILEQELLKEPDFSIGNIQSIQGSYLTFRYFTGIARWLDEVEKIEYSNITSCQIGNNYLNVYERYFQRKTL